MMEALYFKSLNEAKSFLETHQNKGIVLFASDALVHELSQFSNENVVLCSTAGEFTKEGFKEDVLSGFSYDLDMGQIIEIKTPAIRSIEDLTAAYNRVKDNKNACMLLLCNGLAAKEESIMTTLFFMKDDFKIIGGSAGDYLKFKETLIFIGNKKVESVGIFFNMKRRTQLIKENIYQTTGKKLLVTDADPISRTVYTFDNVPAASQYAKVIGINEAELANAFANHPIGRVGKQNTYISSPMKINSDKSITFYSQILPNTFVELLEAADVDSCISKTTESFELKPSFVLSVHCILRSLKFKDEGLWKNIDQKLLQTCKNQAGFISYGEQIYKKHLNQTMVLLIVE